MSSSQEIYNAVRSRIINCDVGQAIENAIRAESIGWHVQMAMQEIRMAALEQTRPSVLMRPSLYPDGDMWCALYGDDLQTGVAGFGKTPAQAMVAFDLEWMNAQAKKGRAA